MIYIIGLLFSCIMILLIYVISKYLRPNKITRLTTKYSSKIKSIYVELHNYTFFHSPEGVKKSYSRYVGRKELKQKIKSILTNSETKSGAYLVTGFRGMGKTSLVRRAIAEMKGNYYYALSRHVRQFFVMFIVYLVYSQSPLVKQEIKSSIAYILFFICLFASAYLIYKDKARPNLFRYYKRKYILTYAGCIWEIVKSFIRIFDPETDYYKRSKFKTFLQDIIITTILFFIATYFMQDIDDYNLKRDVGWLVLITFSYFVIVFVNNNFQLEILSDHKKRYLRSFIWSFKRIIDNAIKRLDYGNKIPIEISLSQDDLKEIDILKLLSKNIYMEYKSLRNRILAPNRILIPIVRFAGIYLIISLLYYFEPIYNFTNEFRFNSGLVQYFPSQSLFPYYKKNKIEKLPKDIVVFDNNYQLSASKRLFDEEISLKRYIYILNERLSFIENYSNKESGLYRISAKQAKAIKRFLHFMEHELPISKHANLDFKIKKEKLLAVLHTEKSILVPNFNFNQILDTLEKDLDEFAYDSFLIEVAKIDLNKYIHFIEDEPIRLFFITLDRDIQILYQKLIPQLYDGTGSKEPKNIEKAGDFQFPPIILDYFFIVILFLAVTIFSIARRHSWRVGLVSHSYILRRLKQLNENIAAQITHERQNGVSGDILKQTFNFFTRRRKVYPIAGVREIENELIDILREIDKIPSIASRPEFIFIFDELDKIEAQYNVHIQEKEGQELASFGDKEEGYFSTESIRKRQETIARILGNLKLFFNTARAKFIFIAGREMYDASLADISDRDSFISSIFHEIVYVESFFKDPGSQYQNGITGLTEEFVCQLLMPRTSIYSRNLKGYNDYLKDNFTRQTGLLIGLKKYINLVSSIQIFDIKWHESTEQSDQRRKVIYTLQQFITFLTYRGNGSPKKITKLLEGFIHNVEKNELTNHDHIALCRNSNNLYLVFDELCQYRLGLTHYLFKPYLMANVLHMRHYADKTLVATSFLVDHLYKYHNAGFSWENLELTPEIIAVNRSPRLRKFISQLMDFMSNNHIEEIINGLYQFRFNIRLSSEIAYISTISESESAAFNFTLDESLLLKRHYRKKLKSLDHRYRVHLGSEAKNKHIAAIAYINSIIGDLHFYDREYDEAILHYKDAGQFLFDNIDKLPEVEDFIFLIKLLLKTGLTYEKMRDYDTAFITVGRVAKMIRDFSFKYQSHDLPFFTENRIIKKKVFENMRLIFQPLITQFMLLEKGGPNGLTADDLVSIKTEFNIAIDELESDEKFIIEAEFENKLGDILFFKNGALLFKDYKKEDDHTNMLLFHVDYPFGFDPTIKDFQVPISAYRQYFSSLRKSAYNFSKLLDVGIDLDKHTNSLDDCIKIISLTLNKLFSEKSVKSDSEKNIHPNLQNDLLKAIGSNLSDLVSSLISFLSNTDSVDWQYLAELFPGGNEAFDRNRLLNRLIVNQKQYFSTPFRKIIYLHLLSTQFYIKAGDYHRYASQMRNLLILLKRILDHSINVDDYKSRKNFQTLVNISGEALMIIDRNGSHTRRQQLYEWESYFQVDKDKNDFYDSEISEKKMLFIDSIVKIPESKEVYILIKELQLRFFPERAIELLKHSKLSTPYATINNQYNRIFELYFKCNLNYQIFKSLLGSIYIDDVFHLNDLEDPLQALVNACKKNEDLISLHIGRENNQEDILIYLLSDSLYNLTEVLRSFSIFGINYIFNHTLVAMTHQHLGKWSHYYNVLKDRANSNRDTEIFMNKLDKTLKELIGNVDFQTLDVGYHYKRAIEHFYSSIEMHNGAPAYKSVIQEMYYLDDDFDDNLSHFCAAVERYRINTGYVRNRIERLKTNMSSIDHYTYKDVFLVDNDI